MTIAQSKLTAQGQISIPAEVRKRLGIGPSSVLEWEERDDEIFVRRAGKYSSSEVHAVLFAEPAATPRTAVKEGIRSYIRKKHARR